MTEPFDGLPSPALLRIAYNVLSARIFASVSGSGFDDLRPSHGNALEQLAIEDGLRLTGLATRAGMTAQSMGELVDDLVTKGYVERRPDPDDRRAKRIHLTDRGRVCVRASARAVTDVEKHLADLLGQQRYRLLRRTLEEVITAEAHDDNQR